jgi:hypothetical protein
MKNRVVGAILIGMLIMSACSFSDSNKNDTEVVSANDISSERVSEESNNERTAETTQNDGSIDSQIQVIVKNRDFWQITYVDGPVISPFSCYYITDYDHNGRLEITASECQGTGIYTSTSIYEVNSDFNGIELIDDNGDAPEFEYEKIEMFYNEADQTYMYIGTNHGKSGALWGGNIKCALYLEDGVIHYDKIAAEEYQPKGEDSDELVFSYTDNAGATITKEQFETAEDELYKSYDQQEVSFGVIYNEYENVFQELPDDIMAQMLMKSYETFSGKISYDEFNEIEKKIRTA